MLITNIAGTIISLYAENIEDESSHSFKPFFDRYIDKDTESNS